MVFWKLPGFIQVRPLTEKNGESDQDEPLPVLNGTKADEEEDFHEIFQTTSEFTQHYLFN